MGLRGRIPPDARGGEVGVVFWRLPHGATGLQALLSRGIICRSPLREGQACSAQVPTLPSVRQISIARKKLGFVSTVDGKQIDSSGSGGWQGMSPLTLCQTWHSSKLRLRRQFSGNPGRKWQGRRITADGSELTVPGTCQCPALG